MDEVHALDVQPLVVRGAALHWFRPEQLHNPSHLAIVGDLPTRSFELFVQEIDAGGASDMQRHHHESVHYVIAGTGHSEIEDHTVTWGTGDFVYTPPMTWHRHYNDDRDQPVRILGIENSRLLGLLGGLNRRESLGLVTMSEARTTLGRR